MVTLLCIIIVKIVGKTLYLLDGKQEINWKL